MDAFYASVEQRDNPELRGKPVAVGGSSKRGVVAAASYEARKYGVFSAMPSVTAKRKCPNLIFTKPRFDIYKKVSIKIREIFSEYTDIVEPLSLDEAFLDVTSNKKNINSATLIAREIKSKIKSQTQLTASAGISVNKFLAKVASDLNKPDGLTLIPPGKVEKFIEKLSIKKFYGVGKATAKKMKDLGIQNGADLKSFTENELVRHFGKHGHFYYKIARGIDERDVNPERIRKSISAENTFSMDLMELEEVTYELDKIAHVLHGRMQKSGFSGRTLTLKVKYADFKQITRSKTVNFMIKHENELREISREIINDIKIRDPGIRLLGLGISNLNKEKTKATTGQLTLNF